MNLQSTNITIAGINDKGLTLQILDSSKKKWTIWKNKKGTATSTDAFEGLQNFKVGDTTGVSFTEIDKTFVNQKGETIPYTERTIYSFLPLVKEPAQISTPARNSQLRASGEATNGKGEEFWDKKAYKQCLWNFWLASDGRKRIPSILEPEEMDTVWQVFNQINQDADKRFSSGWDKAVKTFKEELPVIQQDEPPINSYDPNESLTGEDTPF